MTRSQPRHRLQRLAPVLLVAIVLSACDGPKAPPTGPSPVPADPAPAPPRPPVPESGLGVRGTVYDTAFRRLAGATVEVVDGPQAGLKVSTSAEGEFTLPGAFDGTTHFRASSDGYLPVTVQHPHGYIDYYLVRSMPPVNIRGNYDLTFIAAPDCTAMPEYLIERTYRATVTPGSFERIPAGMVFDLALAGVEPLDNPAIGVAGNAVGFRLFNDGYPFIVERVAANLYVTITGWAEVPSWPDRAAEISVPFDGWITALEGPPLTPGRTLGHCKSTGHRLVIRPAAAS